MVVDDDESMCDFLRAFLIQRGYNPITFCSADEAVDRYVADRPAAVILDLVMPGRMDGLEALAAFKKIDRDVPVIVLSGQGRTNVVVQAMKLGAADFVSKPVDDTDLDVSLASAMKQRQLSREVATLREQVRELINRIADTEDLFFSLNAVCIQLPPLRERNVRELENLIKRAVVLGSEAPIRKELSQGAQSPTSIAAAAAEAGNYSLKDISRTAAREAERELILRMLQQTRWNRKETAEILGISYKALLYKIKENGLDKAS